MPPPHIDMSPKPNIYNPATGTPASMVASPVPTAILPVATAQGPQDGIDLNPLMAVQLFTMSQMNMNFSQSSQYLALLWALHHCPTMLCLVPLPLMMTTSSFQRLMSFWSPSSTRILAAISIQSWPNCSVQVCRKLMLSTGFRNRSWLLPRLVNFLGRLNGCWERWRKR